MTTLVLDPPQGRSALPFVDARHPQRPLEVNFYRPARHGPDDEVVFVQHGMLRNGDDYRDFWIEAAEKHNLLIVAPTFGNEHYPKAEGYNNGLLVGEDGAIAPQDDWLYAVPARVLAALRKAGVTRRDKVKLFGHSAGGQFVHRLLATQAETPYEAAFAANSGWYTLPTLERRFPEGLDGLGLGEAELARWLAWPMVIFAGDQDIVTSDPNLPAQAEALAQGPMRYARAHFMLDFAKAEAARRGLPCSWSLITVPGIGHDGAAMSRAAAAWWYEGRIPSVEVLRTEAAYVA
ncbi:MULTISPECIES: alpha/beta hydrolase [unclassified Bosea (in: a-proteobacteria)]|uniref:alpha/beta hydrolase n=1 Tax=unclassified Bosea (in: a-proteobacteria) TaxID=2653178 RepID=UPI000F75292B|nr:MULTISPECIES: alpha/beta hydrolase [unclassified Bosea (in: a-proteobacteria)]AZO79199.1 alpha/beta hydrolase [Bosea sp. Tri-49]RXT27399.1 alpha/beta hydrolase [Bosea sp. Tri-39]RXT35896.1 alpha/beta hydrolase [Bosea sp. Tri-54]